MLHATIFVEFLRSRPHLTVWAMALLQGLLWTLIPTFFYAAPPGQLPESIAIGHELQFGSYLGPPLAQWLAGAAYTLGKFWIYLLSQVCVVVTYWAVFQLGAAIVGQRHAAFAILLMGGVFIFTIPTPEFGPSVLAMALWSLALLHYWRAAEQSRFVYWFALGIELGLLLLTSYASIVFVLLLTAYLLITERGRERFTEPGPWIAGVIAALFVFPLLIWIDHPRGAALVPSALTLSLNPLQGARLLGWLLAAHAGFVVLIALGFGLPAERRGTLPMVDRAPVDPVARIFVYYFALAPAAAMMLFAMITGGSAPIPVAPLAVLSGLAVMVAAPDSLPLVHQRLAGYAWALFVVVPPLLAIVAVTVLPWIYPLELSIDRPAAEMGRFFADRFERSTGRPLAIVVGDESTAMLVAMAAPSRPSVYFDAAPERTPWVNRQDIENKGAIIVWPTTDTAGRLPPAIKERFPDLVPNVPQSFDRLVQGRLPPVRIGWAVIRPRSTTATPPPPPPQPQPQVQPQSQIQSQPPQQQQQQQQQREPRPQPQRRQPIQR
jgi:hypothetical protein